MVGNPVTFEVLRSDVHKDIIREWQAMSLYRDYKLTNVHIFRDEVSRSFKDQVLTT